MKRTIYRDMLNKLEEEAKAKVEIMQNLKSKFFLAMVVFAMVGVVHYQQGKIEHLSKAKTDKINECYETQICTSDLKKENESLKSEISSSNQLMVLTKIMRQKIPFKDKIMAVAIAYTESSLNPNVKHPDRHTYGVMGTKVDTVGGGVVQKFGYNPKTIDGAIMSGVSEYYYWLAKTKNRYTALSKYKGAVSNFKSTNKTWELYNTLLKKVG